VKTATRRPRPLGVRLLLAIAVLLLPHVVAGGVGVFNTRTSGRELDEFRTETADTSRRIEKVSDLLVLADDAGKAYVETGDRADDEAFADLSGRVDAGFADLAALDTPEERALAAAAQARWETAFASVEKGVLAQISNGDALLDLFHDDLDEARSLLTDADKLNLRQVAVEIAALRARERLQIIASFGTFFVGVIVCGWLSLRIYKSIATPLSHLEKAATRFGSNDLSHRITVTGNDELATVSRAFNLMADRLQESQDGLQHEAFHDRLTGLPNRARFMEQMEKSMARAARRGTPMSVLYLDLDGFKVINDTLGHQAGDEILVAVSNHLRKVLRSEDAPARLGGDEFGVLLDEDVRGAVRVAERIGRGFDGPWSISSGDVAIGISIGIATRQGGEELDELLRHADAAMYEAKSGGQNRWQVFTPEDAGTPSLGERTLHAVTVDPSPASVP
jgi:diguanylate cyclase (GGDEF)-like protein